MKRLFILLFICCCICNLTIAQTTQPFGKIDTADLRLTTCDFEKNANAMVLFDKAEVSASQDSVVMYRYKRVKIFNNNGKGAANIRLPFYSSHQYEKILAVEAQTINLVNNKIVYTRVEPADIYTEMVDKDGKALVFAFPNVKPGSVIEYKYKWKTNSPFNFPTWFFQSTVPTRFSEITAFLSKTVKYQIVRRGYQPFSKTIDDTIDIRKRIFRKVWAKTNVPSVAKEPFVTIGAANFQCLIFQLRSIVAGGYIDRNVSESWQKIAVNMSNDWDFGIQLIKRIGREDTILNKVKLLSNNEQKIAYLFNLVKTTMKWNGVDKWYADDGTRSAWNKRIGNSTEINLILLRLLKRSGVDAHVMLVSTRENGAVDPLFPTYASLNKAVVYITADSAKYYVLDATSKYNVYNNVPLQLVNTWGLIVDQDKGNIKYKLTYLKNDVPAQQVVIINGNINANGKLTGTAEMINSSYNRENFELSYEKLGLAKYIDALRHGDNQLAIYDFRLENMEVDSLPVIQKFNFDLMLTSSDEKYIYFDPNIFTPLHSNPFLNQERSSDIDFGNCNAYSINGRYKMPAGYKIDALPKNLMVTNFDKSISFKRVVGEVGGFVELHYTILQKRSKYGVGEYQNIREFYKKMFDMLSEPVVLKKG